MSNANRFLSVYAGVLTTFDRYGANQVVQLLGVDDSEDRMAGLVVSDSPSGTDVRRRIRLGRAEDGTSRISVLDAGGKTVKELLP